MPAIGAAQSGRSGPAMMHRIGRYVALGVALFLTLPLILFAWRPTATVELAADPPRRVVSGIYPSERTPDGLSFAWTRETFALTLPRLDRRVTWRLTLRIAASRPDGSAPTLVTSVDGVTTSAVELPASGYADHVVSIPSRADRPRSTSVGFGVTPPFVPDGDPRQLGAQIDRITLQPVDAWPRLWFDWRASMVWGVAAGLLAASMAVPASVALAWLGLTALLVALAATTGLAPYAGIASWPALGVGLGAAAIAAAVLPRARSGAAAAVLITFTASSGQILVLMHPDMPLGDALFHAHRFQNVLSGQYFFTSTAPGDYQFPYAVGLYLASQPFARFTHSALENATLLRILVVVTNAAAASLLYRVATRWRTDDDAAGAAAVASFHLVPLSFGVIGTGNLTNAFAQSMAIASLTLAAIVVTGVRRPVQAWAVALVLFGATSVAFLSHASTFAVLGAQLGLAGLGVMVWQSNRSGRDPHPPRWALLAICIAAAVTAIVVYYAHFGDVYREAWGRITAETGQATEAAGGRTPYTRLVEAPQWLVRYYGLPTIVMTAIGLLAAIRGGWRLRSEVSLLIFAWVGAAAVFLAVGILTPVDLRHFYAAVPAVAVLCGLGASWLWRRGAWAAAALVVFASWAAWLAWSESSRFLSGW